MQCPVDGETLVMSERQGVEVDYCPKCRGVWLDRGELDKIVERAAGEIGGERRQAEPRRVPDDRRQERDDDDRHGSAKPYRKRKSFLNDIFDF